jgi:ABC-type thiamin/hydroxymethylpyrimidine transport system permease subunit
VKEHALQTVLYSIVIGLMVISGIISVLLVRPGSTVEACVVSALGE